MTSAELRKIRSRRFYILACVGSVSVTIVLNAFVSSIFSLGIPWLILTAIVLELIFYWLFFALFMGITNHCGVCTLCFFSRILHVPMGGSAKNDDCGRNKQPVILVPDRFALIEVSISKRKLPSYVFKHRKKHIAITSLRIKDKVYTKDAFRVFLGSAIVISFVIAACLLINATMGIPSLDIVMSSTVREAPLVGGVLYAAEVVEKVPTIIGRVPFNLDKALDIEYSNRLAFVEAYSDICSTSDGQYIRKYRLWYAAEPIVRKFFRFRKIPCYIYTDSIGISRVRHAQRDNGEATDIQIFTDSIDLNDLLR